MANSAKLYQTILAGLEYRGTAFFQSYTSCQPEHGVADNMSAQQAKLARDSRGMPEFVFDPQGGEMTTEFFLLKGNPNLDRDLVAGHLRIRQNQIQLHCCSLGNYRSPLPQASQDH